MTKNNLIIVEKDRLFTVDLDEREEWSLGRMSRDNKPDIPLNAGYVSRKHGHLSCMGGMWFYTDYNSKNGTAINGKHLSTGIHGRYKPVMLNEGDTFVLGGGEKGAMNEKTAWALFLTRSFDGEWRILNTSMRKSVTFTDGTEGKDICADEPGKAGILQNGMGIYMGDKTYLVGDIWLGTE